MLLDYAHGGLYSEALTYCCFSLKQDQSAYPWAIISRGLCKKNQVNNKDSAGWFVKKQPQPIRIIVFPNRIEDVNVLQEAISSNPSDPMAPLPILEIFGTLIAICRGN